MTAGRPQKYQDRAAITISLERNLKIVAQAFGIDFAKALTQGIQFLIEYQIRTGKKVDPATLALWKEVKEQTLMELQEYLKIEQDKQTALTTVIESRRESDKRLDEKIEVWDETIEKYKTIKRREFNPAIHQQVVRR